MADDEITARAVKEAAACDETVRHGFTWDNEECGERYRDWQARTYLAALQKVVVCMVDEQEEPQEIRAHVFHHVPEAGAYVRAEIVATHPEYKQSALEECLSKLRGLRKRYDEIEELAPVWAAIDSLS